MDDLGTARRSYLRAVIAALTDEVSGDDGLSLTARRYEDGHLDVQFRVRDAGAFNARVSRHAETMGIPPTTDAAGDD